MNRTSENARAFALLMAARYSGHYLYAWGGEDPDEGGYDCSGFVCSVLEQVGRAWPDVYGIGRTTAQGLADYYRGRALPEIRAVANLRPGCLLFYRVPGKAIHHVALHCCDVPALKLGKRKSEVGPIALEAGGSGSAATSPRAALLASASVRPTASDYHGRGVEWFALDPFALLER